MAKIVITDATFEEEVLKAKGVVLVDFWAEWCMPCQMLGPIIEEIANETEGTYKIGKLDVDANQETAGKYQVMSIPSVLIFKDGELVETIVGVRPKASYLEALEKAAK
jgi:thioredoxin 1